MSIKKVHDQQPENFEFSEENLPKQIKKVR
jgi:hypothetical protein